MPEIRRIIDETLEDSLQAFGGVLIEGPSGCGKSYTARKFAKSVLDTRDAISLDKYRDTSLNAPDRLLIGDNPRLIIDWQNTPEIWDASRYSIDERNEVGLYIFTGQSSDFHGVMHNGFGRIDPVNMWPASLYESGESSGKISLCGLIDNPESFASCKSFFTYDNLVTAICRGGWPECITHPEDATSYVADLLSKACSDVKSILNGRKSADVAREIIRFYSGNLATSARDLSTSLNEKYGVSKPTVLNYVSALKQLYIIEDIPAWNYRICDAPHRVMSQRRNVADPSVAVSALGIKKEDFNEDFGLLRQIFKCLCYRDVKVYSESHGGKIYFYEDRHGTSADCVLKLFGGRYALVDFRLGQHELEDGVKSLCRVEKRIHAFNKEKGRTVIEPPAAKIILTSTGFAFKSPEGVFVIPVECLKN